MISEEGFPSPEIQKLLSPFSRSSHKNCQSGGDSAGMIKWQVLAKSISVNNARSHQPKSNDATDLDKIAIF